MSLLFNIFKVHQRSRLSLETYLLNVSLKLTLVGKELGELHNGVQ